MKTRLDKRLFERLQAPMTVKYELPNGATGKAIAKDISMEGARLQLPQKLDVDTGTKLRLEIQIPGRNRATTIIGDVIWRRKFETSMKDYYDVGIKFIQVDPFDMEDTITKLRKRTTPPR